MEKMNITDLADQYLLCRTLGHSWDDNPTAEVDSELFKASRGVLCLRCVRCTTERFDYIGNDMLVFQRYYRYPEKYTTIPGMANRPNLREELLSRHLMIRAYRQRNSKRR